MFNASIYLCLSGYELIKKCYHTSLTVIYIANLDGSFEVLSSNVNGDSIVLRNRQDCCSCYISSANLMQCKHQIPIHRQFDITKIDRFWYKRKGISMSSKHGSYVSPRIF